MALRIHKLLLHLTYITCLTRHLTPNIYHSYDLSVYINSYLSPTIILFYSIILYLSNLIPWALIP